MKWPTVHEWTPEAEDAAWRHHVAATIRLMRMNQAHRKVLAGAKRRARLKRLPVWTLKTRPKAVIVPARSPEQPAAIQKPSRDPLLRFLKYTTPSKHGCWMWSGTVNSFGRAIFNLRGTAMNASRAAYLLMVGPIEGGLLVCHTCDNGLCVNPLHFFLGTHRENIHDAIRKGRFPWKSGMLDRERALALFAEGKNDSEIAFRLGVSHTSIWRLLKSHRAASLPSPSASGTSST